MNDLPETFEYILVGTSLQQSILAAALSRVGHTVLHVDPNDTYGSGWATYNIRDIESWVTAHKRIGVNGVTGDIVEPTYRDGESLVDCVDENIYSHIELQWHLPEEPVIETSETNPASEVQAAPVELPDTVYQNQSETAELPASVDVTVNGQASESERSEPEADVSGREEAAVEGGPMEQADEVADESANNVRHLPSRGELESQFRRFALELTPRVQFSGGRMTQLLIDSGVARYCEFKSVGQVLVLKDGAIDVVPVSRGDIFSDGRISLIQKRLLMRFFVLAYSYQDKEEEYLEYKDAPFVDFLNAQRIPEHLAYYIRHAIAIVDEEATTLAGLEATQRFLLSCGRYGNSPYLWPLYGTGELPQCFSRLCAVFGGIFMLRMRPAGFVVNYEQRVVQRVAFQDGQTFGSQHVISEHNYIPHRLSEHREVRYIHRAIFVTNGSLLSTEADAVKFLTVPPAQSRGVGAMVHVLELTAQAQACPSGTYVVHLTTILDEARPAKELFQSLIDHLFVPAAENESDTEKPRILWSLYFTQESVKMLASSSTTATNLHVTSSPDAAVDMEAACDEAEGLFRRLCPTEDFLPKPPNPEDILFINDMAMEGNAAGAGFIEGVQPQQGGGEEVPAVAEEQGNPDAAEQGL